MYQKNPVKKLISSTLTFLGCSIAIPAFFTAPANANYVLCTPTNVGVFPERIHIRCTQNFGGVIYFAVSTSNANFANRVLDVWKTGLTTGRQVGIDYNPSDLTGSSVGCLNQDCRIIRYTLLPR